MQKLARDRVRTTTPLGSGSEQRLTKELQEAMKGGGKVPFKGFSAAKRDERHGIRTSRRCMT